MQLYGAGDWDLEDGDIWNAEGFVTYAEDPFAEVRSILAPQYANEPAEVIEAVVEEVFGADAAEVEDLLGSLMQTGGNVVQALPVIIPGALAGAAGGAGIGATVGAPFAGVGAGPGALAGTLIGAGVGALPGLLSALSATTVSPQAPASPPPQGAPRQPPRAAAVRPAQPVAAPPAMAPPAPSPAPPAPAQPPMTQAPPPATAAPPPVAPAPQPAAAPPPAIPQLATQTSAAAAQLLQVLSQPEVLKAITSMAAGLAGSPTVAVEESQVPVGAFANLIEQLARRAALEHHGVAAIASQEHVPDYLLAEDGSYLVDPANPEQRAAILLLRLIDANAAEAEARVAAAQELAAEAAWPDDDAELDPW